jgi:hypothetical protein
MPEAEREAKLAAIAEQSRADQEASKRDAHARGQPWTDEDDQALIDGHYLSERALAAQLGRTVWAIKSRREVLRRRGLLASKHRRVHP